MAKTYNKNDTTKITNNFKAREMDCKCSKCSTTLIDERLIKGLQVIRDYFGKALNITSGYRCPSHNSEVGGAKNSYHMKGMAADVYINGVTPLEIAQYAESTGLFNGIGRYGTFVHLDVRPSKYFWENLGKGEKAVSTHGKYTVKNDNFYGRLNIDAAGINVGLYESNSQEVCDKIDSACFYTQGNGRILADHNNQSFKTLPNVKVGDIAKITTKNGNIEEYKCIKALNGHNTGTDITDENYNSLYNSCDILAYTCRDNWQNVSIRLFNKVEKIVENDAVVEGPKTTFDELFEKAGEEAKKAAIKYLKENIENCFYG